MTRRAAIAALAALFAALGARDAHAEWVMEVVTNRVEYDGVEYIGNTRGSYDEWRIETGVSYAVETDEIYQKSTYYSSGNMRTGANNFLTFYTQFVCADTPKRASPDRDCYDGRTYEWWGNKNQRWIKENGSQIAIDTTPYTNVWVSTQVILFNKDSLQTCCPLRTYSFWMKRNGKYTINLVPIRVGSTGYMLDCVSGRLLGNSGSGVFTLGSVTGVVSHTYILTNRVYRAPAPMRSFDAQHPFNNAAARTRLGGTGNGEDGTTLSPTARIAIKKNEED